MSVVLSEVEHIVSAPCSAAVLARNTYETLLRRHDWTFAWSDDQRAYSRGFEQRKELDVLRREIDPDFAVWNQFAPESCRNGAGAL